jgi:hypothetical protein
LNAGVFLSNEYAFLAARRIQDAHGEGVEMKKEGRMTTILMCGVAAVSGVLTFGYKFK